MPVYENAPKKKDASISSSKNKDTLSQPVLSVSANTPTLPTHKNGINALKQLLNAQRADNEAARSNAATPSFPAVKRRVDVPENLLRNTPPVASATLFPRPENPPGHAQDGPTLKQLILDYARNLALDVLIEVVSKLTGLHSKINVVPLLHLIRNVKNTLTAADSEAMEKLLALKLAFNNARASLSSDTTSAEFQAVSGSCLILDILHKSLTLRNNVSDNFKDLGAAVKDLDSHVPLGITGQAVSFLLESADLWQHWKNRTLTVSDFAIRLAEKIAPAQLTQIMKIADKTANSIREGKVRIEGLPEWPMKNLTDAGPRNGNELRSVVAPVRWLMAVLSHPQLRMIVEQTDEQALTDLFGFDTDEITFLRENLLSYVQAFARFPRSGSGAEQIMALMTMPGVSDYLRQADIRLAPQLGAAGNLLKQDARLSDLGRIYSAAGMRERISKALSLVDIKTTLFRGGQALFNTFFTVMGDAVQPLALALRKSFEYSRSAYSVGVSSPSMVYGAVKDFLKADYAANKASYQNISLSTLQALVVFCFTSRSVKVSITATAGEWLEAYAMADPEKLTMKDKFIQHAFLEPMVAAEIYRAMYDEDPVRTRRNLEPLSRALAHWGSESPVLRLVATVIPHFPTLKEAWAEIKHLQDEERVKLHADLTEQVSFQKHIMKGRQAPSPESTVSRQKTLNALQESLGTLQKQLGYEPTWAETQQTEISMWQDAATATLNGETNYALTEALSQLQESLSILNSLSPDDALPGRAAHEKIQQEFRNTQAKNEISLSGMMYGQLLMMEKTLKILPVEPRLTDIGSLPHFLMQVTRQLALSSKPNIQSTRSVLDTALRNFTSDSLVHFLNWLKDGVASLFIREVELSPEQEAMGYFIIETNPTFGQLAAGAATGATAGGLFSLLLLMLSEDRQSDPGKVQNGLRFERTGLKASQEAGHKTQHTVMTGSAHSEVYASTTVPAQEAEWKKLLCVLFAAIVGGVSGMGVAAMLNPPVRKKVAEKSEHSEQDNIEPHLTRPGWLQVTTDENGISRGIILDSEEENPPLQAASPSHSDQSVTSDPQKLLSRQKRFFGQSKGLRRSKMTTQRSNKVPPPERKADYGSVRKGWSDNFITSKVNQELQKIHMGAITRMGAELAPDVFIRHYIQNILDAHPVGRGDLTSPDSVLSFRQSTTGPATKSVKLIDLATGKFNYLRYNPVWEYQGDDYSSDNPYLKFRQALLPNASCAMSRSGDNLANKTPGRSLPDLIIAAFTEHLAKIKSNGQTMQNIATFYASSFRTTASGLAEKSEMAAFKPQLLQCVLCQQQPLQMSLRGHVLSEVVALRHREKILAWDAGGSWMLITDTVEGRKDTAMREWVLKHLDADTQYKFKHAGDDIFATVDEVSIGPSGARIRKPVALHPIKLFSVNDIGRATSTVLLSRVESDMNGMVSTSGEYFVDCLIDAAYIASGLALSALVPGSGIALMLKNIALSAGLTVAKDLSKAALADSTELQQSTLAFIPQNLISSLVIDGGLTLGLPLAKKLLSQGNIKIPWAKETAVVKDVGTNLGAYDAANNLSSILVETTMKPETSD